MAYKTFIFFALNLVYVTRASETNELCPCDIGDLKGDSALWRFLKKLSVEVPEEEKEIYAVIPGELSPNLDCDCDQYRKKRSIVTPLETSDEKFIKELTMRVLKKVDDCPKHHIKFGSLCIREEFLNYDDIY